MSLQNSEPSENLPVPTSESHFVTRDLPGTEQEFPSVLLGRIGNSRYQDSAEVPLTNLGFVFRVDQASYGGTGISASPLDGFSIAIQHLDEETGKAGWKETSKPEDKMSVVWNRGKMHQTPVTADWTKLKFGNEGIRSGIIKVTDNRTGEIKYYALGAQFSGREDSWNVRRGLIEVELQNELPPAKPQLPEAKL